MEVTFDDSAAPERAESARLRGATRGPFIDVLRQLNCSLLVSAYQKAWP